MRRMHATLVCGLGFLLCGVAALPRDNPSRHDVPLHGITRVGRLVVITSRPKTDEALLREVVRRRLAAAGLSIDPQVDSVLIVDVRSEHDTSSSGCEHFIERVTLALQEEVRVTRVPDEPVRLTTWMRSTAVMRFNAQVEIESLVTAVEQHIMAFVAAAGSQPSQNNPSEPTP